MDGAVAVNQAMHIKNVCRICGSSGLYNIFENSCNDTTLCVMLQECSKIEVEVDDLLPCQMCKACTKDLIRCYEFIQTCNQSFEVFLTIANKLDSFISRTREEEPETETDFLTTLRSYYAEFILGEELAEEPKLVGVIGKLKSEYVCRVCLSRSSSSIFQVQYKDCELATLYEECTSLKIKRGDDLPQFICHTCMSELVKNHEFKSRCEQSCETFLKALEETPEFEQKYRQMEQEQLTGVRVKTEEEARVAREIAVPQLLEENYKSKGIIKSDCQHCRSKFPTIKDLLLHKKLTGHTTPEKLECILCQKVFLFEDHLKTHMKIHTAKHAFECPVCLKGFTFSANLKRHMRTHTGEWPYICECCGKRFNQLSSLQGHMQMHSNMKKYKCTQCVKMFYSSTALKSHIRTHEKGDKLLADHVIALPKLPKTYKCSTCGKLLASRNSFQIHLNMHMGVRPYSCDMCRKTFTQSTGLRNHMRIHNGEKPHVCQVCDRAFTQSSQLGYHLKTHSGEKSYTCRFCTKAFALKGNLVVHERIHTGEIPYVCSVCQKGFTNSSALKKHKRAVHGYKDKIAGEDGEEGVEGEEEGPRPIEIDVWTEEEEEKSNDYYEAA